MKTYELIKILPTSPTTEFDFTVTYTHGSPAVTDTFSVFSTAFFISELQQHFNDRLIQLTGDDPEAALITLFNLWKQSRSDNYARRMFALSVQYEPLENYDRIETTTLQHGETITKTLNNSDTRTHNDTDTRTHNNTDTLTYNGSETDASGVYGDNSAQPVNSETSTHSYTSRSDANAHTGTIADAHTGTITDAHSGSITDGHTGTDTTNTRAHGNIGVTTSAQMLVEDLDLLKRDIATIAICDFIDRYTYMVEGLAL